MWRVGNRPLPHDVTIDGGSDWIVLNRNYSRYLATDRSHYLTELKHYYKYSLLPAEVTHVSLSPSLSLSPFLPLSLSPHIILYLHVQCLFMISLSSLLSPSFFHTLLRNGPMSARLCVALLSLSLSDDLVADASTSTSWTGVDAPLMTSYPKT